MNGKEKLLTVGEAAARAGVSIRTLRHYDAIGLLKPENVTPAGYRLYGEKEMSGVLYQVWIEDAKSIETKLTIMKKYGLGGVAAWKLGLEDKAIWDVIDAFVKS